MSRTPSCPTRLPPCTRISHLRTTWTVPCAVGCSRPCCHPRGGHLPLRGAAPALVEYVGTLQREEGRCLLMARSACAAFGGCCSAHNSWFPCVLLCVLLGLVSLPCVGRPCAQLFCCLRSSQFRALSFSAGMLTPSGVRRRGGWHVAPCIPLWLSGCPTRSWVVPGAPGTFAHVSKPANRPVTGVCWGCSGENGLRCCSFAFWAVEGLPV